MSPDRPDIHDRAADELGAFRLKVPERLAREPDATENQTTIIRLLLAEMGTTDPHFVDPETQVGRWQAWPIIEQLVLQFTKLPLDRPEPEPGVFRVVVPERREGESDATENQKIIIRALHAELGITDPRFAESVIADSGGRWQAWSVIEQLVSEFTELRPV